MLRSIEIDHLASYDFEIAFGATMPATRTTAIESDHDPGSRSIDFWIRRLPPDAVPLNARRLGGGAVPHRAGVDGNAIGLRLINQIGELGSHIGGFGATPPSSVNAEKPLGSSETSRHWQCTNRRARSGSRPNTD